MEGYSWLSTVKQNRDRGVAHLCRWEPRVYDDDTPYVSAGTPVCGARPWAYQGLAEEDMEHKCGLCLVLEKNLEQQGELT